MIRTPDQRIRVFVSSTLRELAAERSAVRAAIEAMNLAPVMFELGARPHPPRDLYRSYLAQSDVFVGIYADSYGWVAPGEEVSGLEDEYDLAPDDMPKLIYLKDTAEREPKLAALVQRIKADDTVSYVLFSTPEQLAERVAADMATLLAERFDGARAAVAASVPAARGVPVPYTETIGRQAEVAEVLALLDREDVRLVSLVGPGGIGKSRLAIEIAHLIAGRGDEEVSFVLLEHVTDPARVAAAIADALGVRDSGSRDAVSDLSRAVGDRRMLLVLDNFEQILDAAPLITQLFTALPETTFLVTSRALLRLRGERVFDVQPLALPDPSPATRVDAALESPAVRLFRDRARAASPLFEVTEENVDAVVRICAALEGVPLALELAAARIRVLTPSMLLDRLDQRLPVLVASSRDLPERQRTIAATIEWSVGLLDAQARELLMRLGVFAGDFSLDAVEAIGADATGTGDTLTSLSDLIDNSLVRSLDSRTRPMFGMLATVREFALAELERNGSAGEVRRLHADFYIGLAEASAPLLQGRTQLEAITRLAAERENLRAAGRYLLEMGEVDTLSKVVWDLFLYWWIRGLMPDARRWMDVILATGIEVSDRTRAIALGFSSWVSLWQERGGVGPGPFEESVRLFRSVGDRMSEAIALGSLALAYLAAMPPLLDRAEESARGALALVEGQAPSVESLSKVAIGRVLMVRRDIAGAVRLFDEALAQAERSGDMFAATLAIQNRAWAGIALGEPRPEMFERYLRLATRLGNADGAGYAFDGLIAIAVLHGDPERAGVLAGAAAAVRQLTGTQGQPTIETYQPFVASVLQSAAAPIFEAGRARGSAMTVQEATEFALGSDLAHDDDMPGGSFE